MASERDSFSTDFQHQAESYLRVVLEQKHYSPLTYKSYKAQLEILRNHLLAMGMVDWKQIKIKGATK